MIDEKKLEWKESGRSELYKTLVFTVEQINSISPEGDKKSFVNLDASDWVIVIPVIQYENKKEFIMVKQWRHGAGKVSIEFPGGVAEKEETPEQAAARELCEETGYKAHTLIHLGSVSPNPAIMSNHVHFFAAEDLENTGITCLDEDEYVNLEIMNAQDVFYKMGHGEFIHSLMCTALLLYIQKNPNFIL